MSTTVVPDRSGRETALPAVRLRLLGPVGLEVDHAPLTLGGPRAQAVLAVLAVRAGEIVTADHLIDEIWGEYPPRAARVSVQTYLSRLRSSCPPATDLLLPRHPRGYVLDPSFGEIDTRQFEQLSKKARTAASRNRWPDSLQCLQEAARLWQGEPFTGIDEVASLGVERRRLVDLRTENRFSELHAALEVRGPSEVIGPLREVVDAQRWDERGWRLLMLALYRAGRQTEALEVAARARRMLVDEQGLEPTPELGRLEQQVLAHDPSLQPAPGATAPRPPRRVLLPLVGRKAEREGLLSLWASTCADRRSQLVLIDGEPGVGKSHLVSHLAHEVEADGASVLVGRCFDEPRLPLQPWSDLLPDLPAQWPAGPAEPHPVIDLWELAAHRLFTAVTNRVRAACADGPALLVAEDVHWAGVAAVRLLEHVLACATDQPLLVVATARSTEADMADTTRGALAELCGRVRPVRMHLGGLGLADLRVLLPGNERSMSAARVAAVWERTGGVPLLALAAVEGGSDVLTPRLARVGAAAAGLAELLAVAGDRYPMSTLGAASGLDEDALGAALGELAGTGLVEPADGTRICYEFTHALFREALDTRLTDLRRVALSRRLLGAADLLPRQVLPSATARYAVAVARSGGNADVVRARAECRLAAEVASTGHEHHEAATWLRRAVQLAGECDSDARTIAELELDYGVAARRAGLPDAREAFLRAATLARTSAHPELLARIGVGWSRGFFSQTGEADADFVAILREALARPEALSPSLRARATATLAAELTWAADGDERFALADVALDLARAAGDPRTVADVLRTRHLTIAAADTLAVRRRDAEELLALAEQLDDVGLRFEALFHGAGPAIADGDVALVERLLGAAGQIAETLRQPALEWSIGWSRASLLLWQGSLAAAEKLAIESADQGVAAGHAAEAFAFLGGQLLEIRRLQGRLGELVPMLQAVPPDAPHSLSVARYLCSAGQVDLAAARLDRVALDDGRLRLRRDILERPSLDDLAFLAARLDRPVLAAAVRAQLEPVADTFGHAIVAHPVGHHWLGVLALASRRPDEAVAHLERAVARHAAADLPLLEAESHIELARARDGVDDRSGAARARTIARDLADRQGAGGLVAAIDLVEGTQNG